MRLNSYLRLPTALFLLLPLGSAGVVDRVAIVIGNKVVTESEVLDDLRLSEFIDDRPLDLSSTARRAAAERLVDQELIRQELETSGFPRPAASEADKLLREFRRDHFHSPAEYGDALRKYGIAEDQLKQRLLWQLTAIRFTDVRFGAAAPEADAQSADRAADATAATGVDQQMEAWLKQARANTKIQFKQEAFQ